MPGTINPGEHWVGQGGAPYVQITLKFDSCAGIEEICRRTDFDTISCMEGILLITTGNCVYSYLVK